MLVRPTVLLFTSENQDLQQLRGLLSPYLDLTCVGSQAEMRRLAKETRFDAVFCFSPFSSRLWEKPLRELQDRYPEVPVIVLSGSGALQECAEALEAGAFDFLVAPYGQRELLAVVEQAVASTQARGWHKASA